MSNRPNTTPLIGPWMLAMISVSAIVGLRNLPIAATYGLGAIFFYVASAILFFIPIALVTAELASTWPEDGGVYAWIKEAYGAKAGTLAVWFEWTENICCLPIFLSFMAGMIAYVWSPSEGNSVNTLAQDKLFLVSVMLSILWGITFINFLGVKTSGLLSTIGVIVGTLMPGMLIIALGAIWVIQGNPIEIELSLAALVPEFTLNEFIHLSGIFLSFAGIEVAAYYVSNTRNPQKTFPKATLLATIMILFIYILGTLSIAIVVPKEQISYHSGLMQGFAHFFGAFDLAWIVPVIACLSLLGAMALLNTWLIGPANGMWESAKAGNLPSFFKIANRNNSPIAILLTQASVGSFLILFALFNLESIKAFYWAMTALATQLILLMYIMIFFAGIKLRFSRPNQPRPFSVPGGKIGMLVVAGLGIGSSVFCMAMGLLPPDDIPFAHPAVYTGVLLTGIALFTLPPLLWGKRSSSL